MLILKDLKSYRWPVRYSLPNDDGKYQKYEFTAEFMRLPQSRLDEMQKQAAAGDLDDSAVIEEVLVGWSDIKTSTGEDFEFNDTNKRILLDYAGMRGTIIKTFFESIEGAVRKN